MEDIEIDVQKLIARYEASIGQLSGRIIQLEAQLEVLIDRLNNPVDENGFDEEDREVLAAFDQ